MGPIQLLLLLLAARLISGDTGFAVGCTARAAGDAACQVERCQVQAELATEVPCQAAQLQPPLHLHTHH